MSSIGSKRYSSSSRTSLQTESFESRPEFTIVCLCSGRGNSRKTLGLAALQPDKGKLSLAQFNDEASYFSTCALLNKIEPSVIAVPEKLLKKKNNSRLVEELRKFFRKVTLSGVARNFYNDSEGFGTIQRLNRFPKHTSNLEINLKPLYYALAAANALIRFTEANFADHIPNAQSLLISLLPPSEKMCQIDAISARELELVHMLDSKSNNQTSHSLLDVVDFTCTAAGQRALKLRILQPFKHVEHIEEQLDNVDELVNNPDILEDLRSLLRKCNDLEKIASGLRTIPPNTLKRTSAVVCRLRNFLALKFNLSLLESFNTALKSVDDANCVYLRSIREILDDQRLAKISNKINDYFIPEATFSHTVLDSLNIRVRCIRPGISATLDEYRALYDEIIRDAEIALKNALTKYELPFKLSCTASRGFHLVLSNKGFSLGNLPKEFFKITSDKSSFHFTSATFLQINERMNWLLKIIYEKTLVVFNFLAAEIEPSVECLYKVAEVLTELDVTCSLAVVASCNYGYVRPKFSGKVTLVKAGRHPVRTRHWTPVDHEDFKTNPIYFTCEERLIVLSGPNNSGKSVYMKQVVLLQILAQIGSYVPAEKAIFRPASSMISRTGHEDDLHSDCSTFVMEMRQLAPMFEQIEEDSLIIIDELGRGTSVEDGASLGFAVGKFLSKFNCFTILSTHYDLAMLLEKFSTSVNNYHMETVLENDRLKHSYTIKIGKTPLTIYGVSVAREHGVSIPVCQRADEVASQISLEEIPPIVHNDNEELFNLRRKTSLLLQKVLFEGDAAKVDQNEIYRKIVEIEVELGVMMNEGPNETFAGSPA